MVREGKQVSFTKEDVENLKVRKYSDIEVEENGKEFKTQARKRRILPVCITTGSIILAFCFRNLEFIAAIMAFIGCIWMGFGELLNKLNYRVAKASYYIELVVDKKLDIETHLNHTASSGTNMIYFYPVEGIDTTSEYRYVCYIDKEQYVSSKCGDIVRVNVQSRQFGIEE